MNKLLANIGVERPLIGMIHFPPMVGYEGYPGKQYILDKAVKEARILTEAGVDAIMVENNYNVPHVEFEPEEVAAMMVELTQAVCEATSLPIGISTLWNDYKTSFRVCQETRCNFIRIPAFVDTVITSYGRMEARATEVIAERKRLNLEHVAIMADVQVKHSQMADPDKKLSQSVSEALTEGADAIIITGKWTGDSPRTEDLEVAREYAKGLPVIVGSGSTIENLNVLLQFATGIIVGTAIKEGQALDKSVEVNLKPYAYSLDLERAKLFVEKFKQEAK